MIYSVYTHIVVSGNVLLIRYVEVVILLYNIIWAKLWPRLVME